MTGPNQPYGAVARGLHWAIAGMIVLQFVLAKLAESAAAADQLLRQLALLANHKSVGITILGLAVLRLAWRALVRPPALPAGMPRWQVLASQLSHWSLYGLLFAMPISGWLMSSASAYSVSWFSLFQIPDLVAPNPELKEQFEAIHEVLAKVLLVLAVLHILAALKHAVVDRDGVMGRMTTLPGMVLFFAVIATGALALSRPGSAPPAASEAVPPALAATPIEPIEIPADADAGAAATDGRVDSPATATAKVAADPAPVDPATAAPPDSAPASVPAPPAPWVIDYAASFIRFTGDQAGAEFNGDWTSWQADIVFAGDNLAASSFDVTIDTAQVNTQDGERDAVLADPEWFDSARHPQAFYRAVRFTALPDGSYSAAGELTIKGKTTPVALTFTVSADGDQRVLEANGPARLLLGQALLDRLTLEVGTGEWEDTDWVGQAVRVAVRVKATIDRR